jgi:4-carboxymuconolactone decarboxylase
MEDKDRYEQGMQMRRAVLGDAHVDSSVANLNDFTRDFQDLVTRYAWGEVWSRPGLPRHTRSLLTLAILVALNREDEFKMHVRAACNNGVTQADIQEVLLHSALYCGLPAANSATQWALQVFASMKSTSNREEIDPTVKRT